MVIALDGENPWDYYPNSGRDFLRCLFDGIQADPALEAVTLVRSLRPAHADAETGLACGGFMGRMRTFKSGSVIPRIIEAWQWICAPAKH